MDAVTRETSSMAIVSLIFGILGWSFLPVIGGLVAVVTGHIARGEIRRAAERPQGDGLAVAGLVLGYLVLAFAVLGLAIVLLLISGAHWFGGLQ
jgi:hypothetical protein